MQVGVAPLPRPMPPQLKMLSREGKGIRNRDLSKKQERFVLAYLDCGEASQAARIAGYPEGSARTRGCENLQNSRIQAAIREELGRRFEHKAPVAFNVLMALATSAESESVRFAASKDILDRAGYSVTRRVDVTHTHEIRSDEELLSLAKVLAARVAEMAKGPQIDAPSTEVIEVEEGDQGDDNA